MTMTYRLVLLRHGESQWNLENRFTGWTDVDLTETGLGEARRAGQLLKAEGFDFDLAFTSVLKRAIRTLWTVLDEMDRMWIPVVHHWRLNERHYGALQGLNKAETAARFGDQQVLVWRRAYAIAPDPLPADDPRGAENDPRYAGLRAGEIPRTECLKDTVARVVPYWDETIVSVIRQPNSLDNWRASRQATPASPKLSTTRHRMCAARLKPCPGRAPDRTANRASSAHRPGRRRARASPRIPLRYGRCRTTQGWGPPRGAARLRPEPP